MIIAQYNIQAQGEAIETIVNALVNGLENEIDSKYSIAGFPENHTINKAYIQYSFYFGETGINTGYELSAVTKENILTGITDLFTNFLTSNNYSPFSDIIIGAGCSSYLN